MFGGETVVSQTDPVRLNTTEEGEICVLLSTSAHRCITDQEFITSVGKNGPFGVKSSQAER